MKHPRTRNDLCRELAQLKPASWRVLRCVVDASSTRRDLKAVLLQLYLDHRIPTRAIREAGRWLEFAAEIL